MSTKRDLKKNIRNTCGGLALDMVSAGNLFPQISSKDVEDIVYDCALLQLDTISRINIVFDRSHADFPNVREYNIARHEYFTKAYRALMTEFNRGVGEIVKRMNAALPDDVRRILKKAANE